MGKLLSYSIVSGLILMAMYLAYKLFISRDNQHNFNRGVLMLIYLVSFCAYPLYNFIDNLAVGPTIAPTLNIAEVESLTLKPTEQPTWGTFLIRIFLIGAGVVMIKTVITWYRIIRVIHLGQKIKKDGHTLVLIDNDQMAPFSWMRYVVINRNDFDNNGISAIIAHEMKHVRSFHWVDLLIAQIVCIVNWFNPAAWLMRDELMLVHEYQADMAVIDIGHNPQEYQMLLIKKAVGARFPSLANSINHSKLKKRITMMYKSKSGAGGKLKALALVPMVALALGVTSVPAVKAAVSTIDRSDVSVSKDSENSQGSQVSLPSGMEILLDGKPITEEEMRALKPEDIGSIIVDKDNNLIVIHSAQAVGQQVVVTSVGTIKKEDIKQDSEIEIVNTQTIVISKKDNEFPTDSDMEIYLDGKKISEEEMKALNPEIIVSVIIDKQNNRMIITTK